MQKIPIETKLAEAARRETAAWTPDCLEPDALMALMETQEETPETTTQMAHVLSCAYCRQEMEAMERTLSRAAKAQTLQEAAAPVPAAPVPSRSERWWEIFRFPAVRFGLAMAGAAAVALLAFRMGSQQAAQTPTREIARLQSQLQTTHETYKRQLAEREAEIKEERELKEDLRVSMDYARGEIKALKKDLAVALKGTQRTALSPALVAGLSASPQERQSVAGGAMILRGNESQPTNGPALLAPVATAVVEQRPAFRWRSLPGATQYQVEILDAQDNLIQRSEKQTATGWTPAKPLSRGQVYRWFVTASVPDKPSVLASGMAKFRVLDKAKAARLAEVNALHLKLGQLYEQANLRDDAVREYEAIPSGNPAYLSAQTRLKALGIKH